MAISAETEPGNHQTSEFGKLEFPDNRLLVAVCGEFDRNLGQIEAELGVQITRRGNQLDIAGPEDAASSAVRVLKTLYERVENDRPVGPQDIDMAIRFDDGFWMRRTGSGSGTRKPAAPADGARMELRTRKKIVEPRTPAQAAFTQRLLNDDMVFGLGPAGTGKTYLAVAVAVSMYLAGDVDRIILSRPAVEAGERLGFLPGDMKEKVDPYMQPLHAALNDFLPGKQLARLIEENRIEIAPLAFMRGRTLENAFAVLDEAQNATSMQMKMFLTRMGQGSRMAITGDGSQIDLPRGQASGLLEAERLLRGIDGISFVHFRSEDVVRHGLVRKIIDAYGRGEAPDAGQG